ncbi:MAG TPA: transglutaminase domain-containing protein [Clostridia bacterium]|nr:transglutaminase domain-containing protein [Clostridia bacterium]
MRKIIISILLLVLTSSIILPITVQAADKDYSNYKKAIDLKILGLFMGDETGFSLDRAPTRIEGACMLVRLLGKDEEANKLKLEHPFTDVPKWADNQIGYMYKNGLTTGIGNTLFGSDQKLSAEQYTTFILRSLGYDDNKGDFQIGSALEKAVLIGLLDSKEAEALKSRNLFLRNDLAGISYSALKAKLKGGGLTLLDKLVTQDKAISKEAARILGLYTSDLQEEIGGIEEYSAAASGIGYIVKNSTDLFKLLRKMLYETKRGFSIDYSGYAGSISDDFNSVCERAIEAVELNTGVEGFFDYGAFKGVSKGSGTIAFVYNFSESEFQKRKQWTKEMVGKAKYIIMRIIRADMTDYEKELAIHDYIIKNAKVDNTADLSTISPASSFTAYGCLVLGLATCEGYSKAVKLLFDLTGMECSLAYGEAYGDGSKLTPHYWNIVNIGGRYYHLDVTFDDPVSNENTLTYYHFNLTDKDMSRLCKWENAGYPACNSTELNYYYKNGLVVNNVAEFEAAVQKAVSQKKRGLELRIKDYSAGAVKDLSKIIFKSGTVSSYKATRSEDFEIIAITDIKYR